MNDHPSDPVKDELLDALRRVWDLSLFKDKPEDDFFDSLCKISRVCRNVLVKHDPMMSEIAEVSDE